MNHGIKFTKNASRTKIMSGKRENLLKQSSKDFQDDYYHRTGDVYLIFKLFTTGKKCRLFKDK